MPPKMILVFCDGTGKDGTLADPSVSAVDGGGLPQNPTNILRLSRAVVPYSAGYERKQQLVLYMSGVGSEADFKGEPVIVAPVLKALGTAVASKIRNAYAFIAQNFEVGDEICLFGFSRGAYTVRKLAGLIDRIGLLEREALGYFFKIWRELLEHKQPTIPPGTRTTRIKCVGVWDTVGSIWGTVDPLSIKDSSLEPSIDIALHALSLQENRRQFLPDLWDVPVWFPGAHSDVGGGYKRTELADLALFWMVGEIKSFINIDTNFIERSEQPNPDPWGKSQPNNAYIALSITERFIIGHETRLESGQITIESVFHESVNYAPTSLKNPDRMITVNNLKKKFGWEWQPICPKLNDFEQYCKDNWGKPLLTGPPAIYESVFELFPQSGLPEQSNSAAVVAGQVLAFLPGLTAQQIEDIENSCLFAQLDASKYFDRQADPDHWFIHCVHVLEGLGWRVSTFDGFQTDTEAQALRSSDKALLGFLAKFLPESSYKLLDETMTNFRKLGPQEEPVVVLNNSSVVKGSANFQIGVAFNSSSGPTIDLGAFVYNVSENIENPLFHVWGENSVTFKAATQNIILNEEIYSLNREYVVQKLAGNAKNLIAKLDPARFLPGATVGAARLEAISAMELAPNPYYRRGVNVPNEIIPSSPGAVSGSQFLAFMPGVNAQQAADVNNSTLYAQINASKKFDRQQEIERWYKEYVRVLKSIGWELDDFILVETSDAQELGATFQTVLKETALWLSAKGWKHFVDMFHRLFKYSDLKQPIQILNTSALKSNIANFQLGVANPVGQRNVRLELGAYAFVVEDEKVNNFLGFEWGEHKITFLACAQQMSLDGEKYSYYRESILRELGQGRIKYICELQSL